MGTLGLGSYNITLQGMAEARKVMENIGKEGPFAMAMALSRTASIVRKSLVEEMSRVFDRPTPYVLGSLSVKTATTTNLTAMVWMKKWPGKGYPAETFLGPQIFGGSRTHKRFEKALIYKGVMPSKMYAVPGSGATMDRYGNMSRAQIIQILSYFEAFSEQGYSANITPGKKAKMAKGTKKKRGMAYFVIKRRTGKLPPGIYSRTGFAWGSAIKPILIFVKKPHYSKRYRFFDVGKSVANKEWKAIFNKAVEDALKTAK